MKSASSDTSSILSRAAVKSNIKLNASNFILGLVPERALPGPRPGQFFMFGIDSRKDPLLRRPFCYFRKEDGAIQILYRVVGRVTTLMTGLRAGETVEILGPLGNGYPDFLGSKAEEAGNGKGKTPLVIAGGVGLASVYPLLAGLDGRAHLFYGERTGASLLLVDELRRLSGQVTLATEDGSAGFKGTAAEAAKVFLKGRDKKDFTLYACGPNGMLKAASALGVDGYIASEEKMACGVGVCLGCAVKTAGGFKRACKDGPVFKIGEALFD
ncbi:MAG: dihydroorotate dehydrogenase electron transfer subunit [Nitrospiraceae bacterium]|nr:dihydroorotate dehydrogenase electron transfer subunit [Nitrospiraceae bacterium]